MMLCEWDKGLGSNGVIPRIFALLQRRHHWFTLSAPTDIASQLRTRAEGGREGKPLKQWPGEREATDAEH